MANKISSTYAEAMALWSRIWSDFPLGVGGRAILLLLAICYAVLLLRSLL